MQFIVIVSLSKDVNAKMCNIKRTSAQDPINFDADPDPGSALEKMDLDPGYFLQDLVNFLTKQKFSILSNFFCSFLFIYFNMVYMFIYFLLNVYISLLLIVQILVQRVKKFFCSCSQLIFCPLAPNPWIRIFLRIRIQTQKAKILRIQRDPKH